ncbi:transglutaminase family protein [Devosia nitrariae]|uniref:Transglutaminase n=1 Tax=Devosia nitrariae TaxID=2071872 RepID=A0ABQ5VYZ5_9HYPH|nr:transglutaminase family protein [Devosia nitrariae]GLQ53045.1 transglutaminase [Devosia nitrariae]
MRIAIHHQLSITPPPETGNMVFQLLMTPRSGATQKVERWSVETTGIGNAARYADAFGNTVHFVNQMRPEGPVGITATGVVETSDRNGVLGKPTGEPVPGLYLRATTLTKVPVTLYGKFRGMKDDRIGLLHALMARVGEVLGGEEMQAGQLQSQDGQSQTQTVGEARKADAALLAHGFIGAARALDIPARYVSGYLLGDGEPPGLHGWAEAYDPGLGWIGFDPYLQICPSEQHVRLCVGLDALSTTPVRAVPDGNGVKTIAVSVEAA